MPLSGIVRTKSDLGYWRWVVWPKIPHSPFGGDGGQSRNELPIRPQSLAVFCDHNEMLFRVEAGTLTSGSDVTRHAGSTVQLGVRFRCMTSSVEKAVLATGRQSTAALEKPMPSGGPWPAPAANESRSQELEAALRERDQVVQMLTQRLEQAADQLDRLQRSGADRRNSTISALPLGLLENQQSMIEQMNRMLGEWEELHATQTLARIESHISELRDLVADSMVAAPPPNTAAKSTSSFAKPVATPPATPAAAYPPIDRSKATWEMIKAAMLDGELNAAPEAPVAIPAPAAPAPAATVTADEPAATVDEPSPLPELPAFIDLQQASANDLRQAVQARDECISALVRRIVAQDQSTRLPDWDRLNHAPQDLRRTLEDLRRQLQDKLRVAEVDLSLQRARMAREEAKLQIKAEQVERQLRRMGMESEPEEAAPAQPPRADAQANQSAQQGRRWLQFLQRSGNGTSE